MAFQVYIYSVCLLWILRTLAGPKRKAFGLGGHPLRAHQNPREAARVLLEEITSGIDPISEKKAQTAQLKALQAKEIAFEHYARDTFIPTEAASYKATRCRLNQIFRNYVFPQIGDMYFADIAKRDIEKILNPTIGVKLSQNSIKKATGARVRNYVSTIIH